MATSTDRGGPSWLRTILGFLVAPAIVPAFAILISGLLFGPYSTWKLFLFLAMFAFGGAWTVGIATHIWLALKRRRLARHYVLYGALAGVIYALLLASTTLLDEVSGSALYRMGFMIMVILPQSVFGGVVTGTGFWLIVFCDFRATSRQHHDIVGHTPS